jgi:RecB family exonuclease
MRKTPEQLEAIKKEHNVSQLWSWSKYNTYKNSPYEFFLKYILKQKEDRKDGIYAVSGGVAHTILEKFYSKELKYENMLEEYENALFTFNMSELKYDRSDEEKNEKIAKKYEYCLRHFFQNHNVINKKVDIERFMLINIDGFLFQAYIDFLFKDKKNFVITDWKTSTIYSGKKIDSEKNQLVLYAEGLHQLGVPIENIKIQWAFLKYVTVQYPQANGEMKERNLSREEIGEKLSSNVKMWLKKADIYSDDEIENFLDMLSTTNNLECLPEDIKNKYIMKDCFVEIPFNQDEINSLKEDIKNTIVEISKKELEYFKTKDERVFWEDITDAKSYYFANLSGYSANIHKPYKEYLDNLNMFKNKDKDEITEDDMSWLAEL